MVCWAPAGLETARPAIAADAPCPVVDHLVTVAEVLR
jgi:predicted secreted protein